MLLSHTQKWKIVKNLLWKNWGLFILWVWMFAGINFYLNDLSVVWWGFLEYEYSIKIPYIFFGISNALLIWLSINLLIDKMKELRNLRPWATIFSLVWTFIALLTWGCPWCIAGVFPLFVGLIWVNTTLYSLPFKGVELQILSFLFLIIGIYFLSKDMSCWLKKHKKQFPHQKKLLAIMWVSLVGIVNAGYLTYYALNPQTHIYTFWWQWWRGFSCDYNDVLSCSGVFNESFAWIYWIPFSLIAVMWYLLLFIVALYALLKIMKNHFTILLRLSVLWIIFNMYIIFNEYLVWVYCILCLICTMSIMIIGILSGLGKFGRK